MTHYIFILYFWWHYGPGLKGLLGIWKNFILFGYNFFSIGLLLNSFFSPWHRITTSFPRGFDPGVYTRVIFENLISRILGAIVRSIVISMGLLFEIIIISLGFGFLILWLLMPGFILLAFIYSIALIFG